MKISIVVPVYNAEKYIHRLVESVLEQTNDNYELILVDDGSSDNSLKLLQHYEKAYKNIYVYTKQNTGPGLSRRYGFEKATGDLIYFVDSDDWITTPTALDEIISIFENNPSIDILFFDRQDIVGDNIDVIKGFDHLSEGIHSINDIYEVVRPGLGAKIFRRNKLELSMFIEAKMFEDLYTTYEYLAHCTSLYYISKEYYTIYHELNSDSLSSHNSIQTFTEALRIIIDLYKKTDVPALKNSLAIRMLPLLDIYWKSRIKIIPGYNSKVFKEKVHEMAEIISGSDGSRLFNNITLIKKVVYLVILQFSKWEI